MNWRRGLLRLWVVATALWMVSVVAVCAFLGNDYEFRGGRALELSSEYWYYRILFPNLVAAARKLDTPLYCMTQRERDEEEAKLAQLEAEEAKRPPEPSTRAGSLRRLELMTMLKTRPVCPEAVLKERDDLQMRYPQAGDIGYLLSAVENGGWVPEARLSFAYWMFGPPISVFILGASLMWALRGFLAR
jgi:hypothetical protein